MSRQSIIEHYENLKDQDITGEHTAGFEADKQRALREYERDIERDIEREREREEHQEMLNHMTPEQRRAYDETQEKQQTMVYTTVYFVIALIFLFAWAKPEEITQEMLIITGICYIILLWLHKELNPVIKLLNITIVLAVASYLIYLISIFYTFIN